MPKRLVDGDAAWDSDKLAACREEYVPHYYMLLPLALANGSFLCDARSILNKVYRKTMAHIALGDVSSILAEFERRELLFRWEDAQGKTWGYWTTIEKRLPSKSDVAKGHYAVGEPVPAKKLAKFLHQRYGKVLLELAQRIGEPYLSELAVWQQGGHHVAVGVGVGKGKGRGGVGVDAGGGSAQGGSTAAGPPAKVSPALSSSSPSSSSLRSSSCGSSSSRAGESESPVHQETGGCEERTKKKSDEVIKKSKAERDETRKTLQEKIFGKAKP